MSSADLTTSPPSIPFQEEIFFITSATDISKKVTQCLTHLFPASEIAAAREQTHKHERRLDVSPTQQQDTVPRIVLICAKSKVACKAITIVEIVKRRIEEQGLEFFQYNTIEEEQLSQEVDNSKKRNGSNAQQLQSHQRKKTKKNEDQEDTDTEDDPFDELSSPSPKKVRNSRTVPIFKIYLSRTRIEEYAEIYRLVVHYR